MGVKILHKNLLTMAVVCMSILELACLQLNVRAADNEKESIIVSACNLTNGRNQSAVCTCLPNSKEILCGKREPPLRVVPRNFLVTVEVLDLSANALTVIKDDSFVSLESLRTLYLQNNLISDIQPSAFRNLFNLSILNLENNKLTRLDPSQITFQHLPSLTRLNLQNNEIQFIKMWSFITMGSPGSTVTIQFEGNPVMCNCEVFGIRNWLENLTTHTVVIDKLVCNDDQQKRLFNDTSLRYNCKQTPPVSGNLNRNISVRSAQKNKDKGNNNANFSKYENSKDKTKRGNKTSPEDDGVYVEGERSTADDVSYTNYPCHVCNKERTGHACDQNPRTYCPESEKMCRREFIWNNADKTMSISSGCSSYEVCLKDQVNNSRDCIINYEGVIRCNFCCLGPTCGEPTGGRTKDLVFIITYVKRAYFNETYMKDPNSLPFKEEQKRISEALRDDLNDFRGGLDIYVSRYEQSEAQVAVQQKQVRVFLEIDVTVLSTMEDQTVRTDLLQAISNSVSNPNGFFQKENIEDDSLYLGFSDSPPCQAANITTSKGIFLWPNSYVGQVRHVQCPSNTASIAMFASRACKKSKDLSGEWENMNDSNCSELYYGDTSKYTTSRLTVIVNYTINPVVTRTSPVNPVVTATSPGNPGNTQNTTLIPGETDASFTGTTTVGSSTTGSNTTEDPSQQASNLLLEILNVKNFTTEMMHKFVTILESLTTQDSLSRPGVLSNVAHSVNHLFNVDEKNLHEAELVMNTSSRLLLVIEHIPERGPLVKGVMNEVTPNLAFVALAVDENESRHVQLVAATQPSSELNASQIQVGYLNDLTSTEPNCTTITIPTRALIKSLPSIQKPLLERVAFSVHQSNKLFETINKAKTSSTTSSDGPASNKSVVLKINSNVISASIPGVKVQNLSENITLTFMHSELNSTNPSCVFWEESDKLPRWSSEGCGVVETTDTLTVCGCNHMTNFALLMDVYQSGLQISELDKKILSIISYVGCGISLAALLLTLMTYTFFRPITQYNLSDQTHSKRKLRRDNPSKILINLCLALMASNLVYLVGMQDYTFSDMASCKAVAVLLHYFLLSSLMWMAVEAFYMYLALVRVFKTYFTNFILKCALVGWGIPLIIVVITLAINTTDNYGFLNSGLCWLHNPAFYAAFVGPVCAILLVNFLAFALVIRQLMSMSSSKLNKSDTNSTVQRLRGAIGVVILLGLSWIFAIFAIDQASVAFYYLFAIFNSLQGLFIFIFYCLLKKDAMTAWKSLFPCFEEYKEKSSSHSRTKSLFTSTTNHHGNKNRLSVVTLNGTSTSTLPPDSRKNSYLNDHYAENKIDLTDININCRKISFAPNPTIPEYTLPESPVLYDKELSYAETPSLSYDEVTDPSDAFSDVLHSDDVYTEIKQSDNSSDLYSETAYPKSNHTDEYSYGFESSPSVTGPARNHHHSDHAVVRPSTPVVQKVFTDDTTKRSPVVGIKYAENDDGLKTIIPRPTVEYFGKSNKVAVNDRQSPRLADYSQSYRPVVHDDISDHSSVVEVDGYTENAVAENASNNRQLRADGEIDNSHIDPVQVIKLKFERTFSDTSDNEKSNI
ncbi:uncharacterized protein LOC106072137 isoform X1 [Biomphalaria glabrata]|uniref:Uncharacterized protein LOC106072137 isoform X1 n=1 Tax=Biomphalaria glabrata TaxID=6526 RepID=A0A9W3ALI5_BIOGL|nr:uncharacterized protein LOC106072137 isoform X1 [Biomphalaria glabrata]XP_055888102.1 uncharacterized protein LOC106072137 isoform X1 [Biomphalaria glabrata]